MEGNSEAEGEEQGLRKAATEECECEEGAPAWVVTFGDLMSLLLTFFVLLLSFSRMDNERFKELAGSLKEAFGVQRIVPSFDLPRGIDLVARDFNTTFSAERLEQQIKEAVKRLKKEVEEGEDEAEEGTIEDTAGAEGETLAGADGDAETAYDSTALEDAFDVEENATGYVIRLDGAAAFESGKGTLRPEGRLLLRAIQPAVLGFGGDILVEGHTDDRPFPGRGPGVDDGNWQLSYDRAHSVVRHLHQHLGLDLDRIGLVARGPSRPRATNQTEEGRAKNRRVEIVLLKTIAPREKRAVEMADAAADPAEKKRPPTMRQTGDTVIPEANFSPLEKPGYGSGPRGLFPD